jgi:signal transduction histidine kinase/ActR/RegA family two-component response regulator
MVMNEIEALRWQLERYRAVLCQQIDRLYNALEELQRTTLLLVSLDADPDEKIDEWLQKQGFAVDEDGFFQSQPLLAAFRQGTAPEDAISMSWGKDLRTDPTVRRRMYIHRNIGRHLKHIHDRLGDVGWIYYQDAANASLQYPFIDQRSAITFDFDWSTYHTFLSVNPQNNPQRRIRWTPPTVDYAGEGVILSVSIPVWRNEAFLGLWSIDLPIRYLYRDFAGSTSFPQQTQLIVDQQGMLLLHETLQSGIDQPQGRPLLHPVTELGGQWQHLDLEEIFAKPGGMQMVADAAGVEWVYCHCHVPGVEWLLFSGLPKASMEEAAARRLQQAFRQISDGNFSHHIETTPTNTLSTLVDAFNKMSTRLNLAEQNRQEMERQLRQAQKMEAVGRLAGGVAHDYNNMISVIMGYTEMAIEKIASNDPLYADLQEIMDAAKRSKELTRQLLAFARRQSIAPKVLDLNDTVKSMLNMLHPLIGEDIELVWRPGQQVWPIQIDPSQIDQILANLCVNARDAISGVGKIIIETANTEIDDTYCSLHQGFVPGEFVRLTVSDDGAGMDAAILNNIFEPFFSTKAIGRGTGLGLATVYGIVKQNNGFINVYSEPGHGTTFKIYLPRVTGQSVAVLSKSTMEASLGNNETVLLVEDDAAILKLSERMLNKLGYRVLAANSPLEAINMAKNHPEPIDLLITDVIMPELNGRDLAKRLQDILPALKVLFMSGYTSNVIVSRGVLHKDVFLLQKPFSKNELATKVREVLTAAIDPMQ